MKQWQKNGLRAVAFSVVLAVCMLLTGQYLTPRSNRYLTGYTAGGIWGEGEHTIDVLVMGDSNAAQGVTPMQWYANKGISGYTYGVGWFSVFKAYYRLQRVFEEQSPRVVFLETDMIFAKQSRESYLNNMVWDVAGELFPLFRYHDEWKNLTPQNLFQPYSDSWTDPNKGYWMITDVLPCTNDDYMYDRGIVPLPVGVAWYLGRIQQLCEENGAQMVLFSVPTATSWNMQRHNSVAAWADDAGVPYLDCNTDITSLGLDWATDTPDAGDHMNLWGARKVTDFLQSWLDENVTLTDHRGAAAWADWDKDLVTYQQAVEQAGGGPAA